MKFSFIAILLLSLLINQSCYKEQIINELPEITANTLLINGQQCIYDLSKNTYYYAIPAEDTVETNLSINYPKNWGLLSFNNEIYPSGSNISLQHIKLNKPFKLNFKSDTLQQTIKLAFLSIPIISINAKKEIKDTTPVYASISIIEPGILNPKENIYAIVEVRGGISRKYDKKSFRVELYQSSNYAKRQDVSFMNMRDDDDWILDAMFIDPMRMRNRVSFDLWFKMVNASDYLNTKKMTNGIHGNFAIVYVNKQCRGLYCLNERFDKKQFKVRDTYKEYGGALYKAKHWTPSVKFKEYVPFTNKEYSNGWKLVYPNVDDNYLPYWAYLDTLSQFMVNANDATFANECQKHINIRSIVDYYILVNITKAYDNLIKNFYLSKYNEYVPFVISPWDLDATWGLFWDRSKIDAGGILSMQIVERLMEANPYNFKKQLKDTWQLYRKDFFTQDSIMSLFENYATPLTQNNAYQIENDAWNQNLNPNEELLFIEEWIGHRLINLDEYFANLE